MLMHFEATFTARTRAEVETKGLAIWREFIEDPGAEMNWSVMYTVKASPDNAHYDVVMTVKDQPKK